MSIPSNPSSVTTSSFQAVRSNPAPAEAAPKTAKAAGKGFSFWDLVDIVNPLQHIPIVSNIYREITGDEIGNVARIAGGALYGGFIGAAIGGVNALAVHETGEDVGQIAMDKMGFKSTVANKPDENLQVIEVHPLAKNADKTNGIVWDTPPKQIAAAQAPIIWDKPVRVADAKASENAAEEASESAALPSPKDLNDIAPGLAPQQAAQSVSPAAVTAVSQPLPKEDVPKNMMQALAKYEAMQRLGKPGQQTAMAQNAGRNFSGLNGIRRYN